MCWASPGSLSVISKEPYICGLWGLSFVLVGILEFLCLGEFRVWVFRVIGKWWEGKILRVLSVRVLMGIVMEADVAAIRAWSAVQ